MAMSTDPDIIEYFPDLYEYGIQDFSAEHEKTRGDIIRRLAIDWWPRYRGSYTSASLDDTLLTESQFTRAAVFHCLSYYILPKLTKHDPEGDRFSEMMKYYKSRYEEEFDLVLKDGVEYDADNDDTIEDSEKETFHMQRLVR